MPKEGPTPTASAEEMELRLGTALSSEHWPSEVRAPMLIPSICVEKSVYIFRLHFRFRSGPSEGCRQDGKVFGGMVTTNRRFARRGFPDFWGLRRCCG